MSKVKKGPIAALLVAASLVGGIIYANKFLKERIGGPARESVVPIKVTLPAVNDVAGTAAQATMPANSQAGAGCPDKPEVRKLIWAWNAQMGELFAAGGKVATKGSLMCQHGVNYKVTRQDDTNKMQAELLAFASELAANDAARANDGKANYQPKAGVHFVSIMGDGAAQFFAALNPQLEKLGKDKNGNDYTAKVIGSAGYSRGEDKFMGLPAWKKDPQSAKGAVIAGVLRDGDWNIAMQWATTNDLKNNPDEKTYDADALNWVNANDYLDAGEKYISGYCDDRPVVSKGQKTGETKHVCVNGVVTWTPGDVDVAEKKGGLVSIVSTREYTSQMPNVIIGINAWNKANRTTVENMLAAIMEGGEQVKHYPQALQKAGDISAEVYAEKDGDYWTRYYRGVTQTDKTGVLVDLGGSKANGLGDNLVLFGLKQGYANAFASTYTEFGNLVVSQYPVLVPSYPKATDILDTSFIEDVARNSTNVAQADVPVFAQSESGGATVSHKSWHFEFDYGKATFNASAGADLEELARELIVANDTIVKIDGYTDSKGNPLSNQALSEARAFAVREYLKNKAPASFPETRFRVEGHGPTNPVASNNSESGRAKNRRVEITIQAHNS